MLPDADSNCLFCKVTALKLFIRHMARDSAFIYLTSATLSCLHKSGAGSDLPDQAVATLACFCHVFRSRPCQHSV